MKLQRGDYFLLYYKPRAENLLDWKDFNGKADGGILETGHTTWCLVSNIAILLSVCVKMYVFCVCVSSWTIFPILPDWLHYVFAD